MSYHTLTTNDSHGVTCQKPCACRQRNQLLPTHVAEHVLSSELAQTLHWHKASRLMLHQHLAVIPSSTSQVNQARTAQLAIPQSPPANLKSFLLSSALAVAVTTVKFCVVLQVATTVPLAVALEMIQLLSHVMSAHHCRGKIEYVMHVNGRPLTVTVRCPAASPAATLGTAVTHVAPDCCHTE